MEHLYNYSLEELTEYFKSINEKPFRAKQVFQWLYQKNAFDFQEMSNISKNWKNNASLIPLKYKKSKYQVMELSNTYLK